MLFCTKWTADRVTCFGSIHWYFRFTAILDSLGFLILYDFGFTGILDLLGCLQGNLVFITKWIHWDFEVHDILDSLKFWFTGVSST
jgi:hypothetical protein